MNKALLILIALSVCSFAKAQDKYVQTKNGSFPIIDQGIGTPILLLHGFPDSKEVWKKQIPEFVKAGFRVIAPDLRGYGNAPSPTDKEEYTIPILMNDIIGILDTLNLEEVHLVGHDWGAALSWQLATYYENRFASLTVLSVGYPGNSAWSSIEQRQKSWYFYLFLQKGLAEKTLTDYDWELTREFMSSHPELEQVIERMKDGDALTTALNWYRGNMQDRLSQPDVDYQPVTDKPPRSTFKVKIPVLGIWSDEDIYLTEAQMRQSTELATDFTFRKIIGAGHWMMLDKPNELNVLMLDFLDKNK